MRSLFLALLIFCSTAVFGQTRHYSGTWTKLLTTYVFEFDLYLNVNGSNQVDGYFLWKVLQYDEYDKSSKAYYGSRIGMTAKEFVRGTFDASKGEYHLKGYKKEDPNAIIGIDTYRLELDENGNIGGTTNANGTWLGRINGKPQEKEFL